MLARLTVYHPERPTQQFYLENDREYFVGRDERCALYVEDRRLSRRHALLARSPAGWELSDLGSKNGTYVGGRAVSTQLLEDPQWLEFGGLLARFDLVPRERRDADRRQAEVRWDTSIALSRAILPTMNPAALLLRVLASVVDVAGAERGFVMLRRGPGEFVVDASLPEAVRHFAGSRSVIERVLDGNRPVACCNVNIDTSLVRQASIVSGGISALACLPLGVGDRTIGVIYVDSSKPGKSYTELDIDILQALAGHAALVIGVARLRENIADLSAMLPTELRRDADPDAELIEKLHALLPRLPAPDKVGVAADGVVVS